MAPNEIATVIAVFIFAGGVIGCIAVYRGHWRPDRDEIEELRAEISAQRAELNELRQRVDRVSESR